MNVIKSRLAEKQPLIQVVVGPRQVGKTTALKSALSEEDRYYTADYPTPLDASVILEWWKSASESQSKILAIDDPVIPDPIIRTFDIAFDITMYVYKSLINILLVIS